MRRLLQFWGSGGFRVFKVVVAGSRSFSDFERLAADLDFLLSRRLPAVEVVSGGARGADALGERYACERGLALRVFPADWVRFGRSAGFRRNAEMAAYADAVVVFWDGVSRGSADMVARARSAGLRVVVRRF